MFAHLKGIIEGVENDHLVIDVQGVGYLVYASRLTLSNLTQGIPTKIFTETLMRQESMQLFGFQTAEERYWFRLLLNVQGVGPKVALGIIGSLGLRDLAQALAHQDKAMLSRAEGVGPKLAGRILLELKDKLKTADIIPLEQTVTPAFEDALSALMNLGYARFEAQKALSGIQDTNLKDSASLIRLALQQMKVAQSCP